MANNFVVYQEELFSNTKSETDILLNKGTSHTLNVDPTHNWQTSILDFGKRARIQILSKQDLDPSYNVIIWIQISYRNSIPVLTLLAGEAL